MGSLRGSYLKQVEDASQLVASCAAQPLCDHSCQADFCATASPAMRESDGHSDLECIENAHQDGSTSTARGPPRGVTSLTSLDDTSSH